MSTLQITRKMASVVKESSSNVFVNLSDQLGGLVLKEEQKSAVEALLSGKGVMAVLPTGFVKSIIYQSFVIAKNVLPRPPSARSLQFFRARIFRATSRLSRKGLLAV